MEAAGGETYWEHTHRHTLSSHGHLQGMFVYLDTPLWIPFHALSVHRRAPKLSKKSQMSAARGGTWLLRSAGKDGTPAFKQ